MMPIISAAITTSLVYLVASFMKVKKSVTVYIVIFLLASGVGFLFRNKAHAQDLSACFEYLIEAIECKGLDPKTKNDKREHYKEKYHYHQKMYKECYEKSIECIDRFPSFDDKEKAKYCFRASIYAMTPGTPAARILYAIMSLATDMGVDAMNDWQRIQNYLMMATQHADMIEFYAVVLNYLEDGK